VIALHRIREATAADFSSILEMVGHFTREIPVYAEILGADPAGARKVLELCQVHGAIYVVEREELNADASRVEHAELVGFACVIAARNPISALMVGEELAWWIEPAHRGGPSAYKLLRSIEKWARQNGCHMLKMVAPAESPKVAAFYELLGYRPAETAYFIRLND
jgi:GNAT superfamily N-acetyltransferase